MAKFNSAARFKCKQSGNVFEFTVEHDIKTMRTHPEYEEVVEEVVEQVDKKPIGKNKKLSVDILE